MSDSRLPPETDLDLDALRAWCAGELALEARRALEARLARDPEAALLAEQLRAVEGLTAPLREPVPPSRLAFEHLPLADSPAPRRWRRVAAAAALLLAVGATWHAAQRSEEGPRPPARVRLDVVRLAGEEPAWPAPLTAGYRPVRDGVIAWFDDAAAAGRLARFTGRRVLLYVHYQGCPLCQALEAKALVAPAVLAQIERLVPLRLDAARLPEPEQQQVMQAGWPYLAVRDAEGGVLSALPGLRPAEELARGLASALAGPAAPAWEESEAHAARLAAELHARRALLAARESAAQDPDAARRRLVEDARGLAGTPAAADVERVLAAWSGGAPFPLLEETPR